MIEGIENIFLPLAQFNFSGGVGNIVAATLETKGLIDQAAILTTFKEQLEWIAAAAWLFSICMGIGAVAVFGNYKQATYLLVGPPLFYYMTTVTIPTDGAKAIFGDREINGAVEEEKTLLEWVKTIGNGNETVNISFFFGVYDSIVTEVVQKVVSVMLDTENQADLRFVARETALAQVLLENPDDQELARLVLTYHVGTCGDLMANIQQEVDRKDQVKIELRNTKGIDEAKKKTLQKEWKQKNVSLDPDLKGYLIGLKGVAKDQGIDIPYTSRNDEIIVNCAQIWDFTRAALYNYAKDHLNAESLQGTAAKTDIPLGKAVEDVKKWLNEGAGGKLEAEKILAVFIYKNMLSKMTPAALQGQVFNRSPMNTAQFEAVFGSLGNSESHGGYMKVKYFAGSLPYIQGLMLYLLTISFPFFAVFLVLPGKAPSFLVWCSLWAWIKSWDIGFALVHVGRDIYWHMMKHKVNIHGAEVEWSSDPSSVIRFAFQNDPLFNQNTYWIITSALTLMVPFVTAHLAMGATGMVDMFKGSIDQVANRFSQTEGNAGRRHEANITERSMEEHQARVQRMAAEQHGRNAGATTMDGKKMPLQDFRKVITFGLVTRDPNTGKLGLSDGVTDARGSETALAGRLGVMTYQLGNEELFSGGRAASIARADEMVAGNKAENIKARDLENAISSGKATDPQKQEYDKLREKHGFTTQAQANEIAGLEDKKLKATNKEGTFEKVEAERLQELSSKYQQGPLRLPESIPHADRGMERLQEKMDPLAMERYASDQRELAALQRQYGRENDAVRFEARATEIDGMIARGESMTKADYYRYEQRVGNDIQDRLVTESRRRQYRLKRAAGVSSMSAYLNARQNNAINAQHFFDSMNTLNSLAIPNKENYLINPAGKGIPYDPLGSIFGGISGGKVSGASGDADADD